MPLTSVKRFRVLLGPSKGGTYFAVSEHLWPGNISDIIGHL